MRYFDGETIRILYRGKRNITGLSDVVIDIWDGTGTKLISADVVSELANGLYYYDYQPSSTGNFTYNITCVSQPHNVEGSFSIVGRNSPYFPRGGGGLVIKEKALPTEELKKLSEKIDELTRKLGKIEKKISELKSFEVERDNFLIKVLPDDALENSLEDLG